LNESTDGNDSRINWLCL